MLTFSQAFYGLKEKLGTLYDEGEAAAIAHGFLEYVTGQNKMDRLKNKEKPLNNSQQSKYDKGCRELLKGRPLQQITGSAWFLEKEFVVNEHVLIPRPETEELVQWITDECSNMPKPRILDVGAGSGCIGISLRRLLEGSVVTCVDVSREALEVLQTNIEWVLQGNDRERIKAIELNFLDADTRNSQLGRFDIIVSNPPYIPKREQQKMHVNVVKYEPSIALFVPDDDALLFYKAIADFGKTHLREEGRIYCELDADHAEATRAMFEEMGYTKTTLKKDMHGKWRMLCAAL